MTTAWFDNDQGRMSPDELETVVFPTSRLGRRGYEEGPVREFLAGVHGEFIRLLELARKNCMDPQTPVSCEGETCETA